MKTLLTSILIAFTFFANSQTACDKIKYMDNILNLSAGLPLQKLRKYENTNFIADSVKQKIIQETIKGSSNSFFQKLQVKQVRVLDSAVRQRIFRYSPVYDKNGDEVDFLYVFLYELKLNGSIPFIFRVDYKRNGELLNDDELIEVNANSLKIVSCDRVISIGLADKVEPITKVESIALYYNPTYSTVVYQLTAPLDDKTQTRKIRFINAYNGKILGREKVELFTPARIKMDDEIIPKNSK